MSAAHTSHNGTSVLGTLKKLVEQSSSIEARIDQMGGFAEQVEAPSLILVISDSEDSTMDPILDERAL